MTDKAAGRIKAEAEHLRVAALEIAVVCKAAEGVLAERDNLLARVARLEDRADRAVRMERALENVAAAAARYPGNGAAYELWRIASAALADGQVTP